MKRASWAERFGRLGEIDAARPETWDGRLFLTIDLDWAIDAAIEQCLDLVEQAGVAATVFVTHDTPLLARMRRNPRLELGLHPNFNPLLEGGAAGARSAEAVMRDLQRLVPEARVVRSHSMAQSSRLLDLFIQCGMTHDSNHFIPAHAGIALKPYRHWKRALTRVPYFWEDDVDLEYGAGQAVLDLANGDGLKVFDFHPIHVALNTPSCVHYETTRPAHRSADTLREAAWRGPDGVRGRFEALLHGQVRA